MSVNIKVYFEYEKDTKNKVRFKEMVQNPKLDSAIIGTLYVDKDIVKDTKKLSVTVCLDDTPQ